MPTKVFLELDNEKKERIVSAALREFAEYGYDNSSTNRIVKNCGISKGSLFKYFESKEELYFWLIETVSAEMAQDMALSTELPVGLTDRIKAYSAAEISWYIDHPEKGRFMTGIVSERGEIYEKLTEKYGTQGRVIYEALLYGADMSGIKHGREDVLTVIRWVLEGFKREFEAVGDTAKLKEEYLSRLDKYMEILKKGL